MIKVVMLGHKAQVGKDTLAAELIKHRGYVRAAFADKLKDTCASLYSLTQDQIHGYLKNTLDPRYNLTPRQMLQKFGQLARELDSNVWPKVVFNEIIPSYVSQGHKKFVITDFRFPNEYQVALDWMKQDRNNREVIAVKIVRPGHEAVEFAGSNDISEHILNDFPYWDSVLINNKTPIDLMYQFDALTEVNINC